jgi:hypothetical protein
VAPDGRLQYELLSAELSLEAQAQRAELGRRFLVLGLRLTNTGYQSGVAIGPTMFRLSVDEVPLAPLSAIIDVVDYQSALDGEVVFDLPAETGLVTLQLGDVTDPNMEFVTLTLDLTGE